MPRFRYIRIDSTGQHLQGELVAADEQAARMELQALGTIEDLKQIDPQHGSERLSRNDSEELAAHLSELTTSGVPLEEGLRVLGDEIQKFSLFGGGKVRRQFEQLATKLEQGQTLDDAVESQGAPADLVAVIRSGLRTGDAGQALTQYVTYIKSLSSLRGRVTISFVYPAILFALATSLFIALMVFIVPDFKDIYYGFGIDLPFMTVALVGVSDLVTIYGGWLFIGSALGVVASMLLSRLFSRSTRRYIQLHIPLFGRILQAISMARFTHALGFLTENEVPLSESLVLSGESSGDALIMKVTKDWASELEAGQSLRDTIGNIPGLHSELLQAVQWESDSRFLARALHALGEMYESRAKIEAARIIAITEPVIALGTGLVFCFTVIGLFLPLIQLMNDLS
ncbi:MAG: type II secretion system F family protein [Planctomycetaceae bacterium]|nr:type II secretion system F family protein [Planctomycetaceae bacterium]